MSSPELVYVSIFLEQLDYKYAQNLQLHFVHNFELYRVFWLMHQICLHDADLFIVLSCYF